MALTLRLACSVRKKKKKIKKSTNLRYRLLISVSITVRFANRCRARGGAGRARRGGRQDRPLTVRRATACPMFKSLMEFRAACASRNATNTAAHARLPCAQDATHCCFEKPRTKSAHQHRPRQSGCCGATHPSPSVQGAVSFRRTSGARPAAVRRSKIPPRAGYKPACRRLVQIRSRARGHV